MRFESVFVIILVILYVICMFEIVVDLYVCNSC